MDWFPQDNRTELKRLLNSQYKGPWHSPAAEYLRRVEEKIAATEAAKRIKLKAKRRK